MSFLDIILGALLAFAGFKGLKNGLFVELASLVSLVLGIYLAIKFSFFTKEIISGFVNWNPNTIQVIAFMITFLIVVVAVTFLGKFLTGIASFAFLGWANSIGGGFFRILKTVLILGIVFSIFEKINYNHILVKKETLDKSIFYNPVQKTAAYLYPSLQEWYSSLKKKSKE
ncbi:CvpA family protein [Flavobacterium sp. SOK18b]|uniref:Membrane protein required for colicin V production n=1 Tax=Flavobacterium tiangeerense TaxID=459471 RepID=A0ABY3FLJ3_9FLAO|nr:MULTISPECIES: CvpA family protein [Flavobacterium]MBB1193711.1 CvpA family protein [Flavobacterium sp. SOK18b]QZK91677.1 CvpA family protein [Flavobacterium sp. CHNK8]TWI01322.1 membrane protein required for colicin V production [Flavobacterium tiangeerense]